MGEFFIIIVIMAAIGAGAYWLGGVTGLFDWFQTLTWSGSMAFIISSVMFFIISIIAYSLIKEELEHNNEHLQKAQLVTMVLVFLLFAFGLFIEAVEPLKGKIIITTPYTYVAFGLSAIASFILFKLENIKIYGNIVRIFLLTFIPAFCWYARITSIHYAMFSAFGLSIGASIYLVTSYLKESELYENGDE